MNRAPAGNVSDDKLRSCSRRDGDAPSTVWNIFAHAGGKQLPSRRHIRIDVFIGVHDNFSAPRNDASYAATSGGAAARCKHDRVDVAERKIVVNSLPIAERDGICSSILPRIHLPISQRDDVLVPAEYQRLNVTGRKFVLNALSVSEPDRTRT